MFALLFWLVILGLVFLVIERIPGIAEYKMVTRALALMILIYLILCTAGVTGQPLPMPRWPGW